MKLVLASQSPRRAELLRSAGFEFSVRPADIDESPQAKEEPCEYVLRLAREKAFAVPREPGEVVVGADTIVVLHGEILGKPKDAADAARMLRMLSGRRHEVITGVCVRQDGKVATEWAETSVWFDELSDDEIQDYVASKEPIDKAGAYAIQGRAARFVERIDGDYSNVVGLPVGLVYRMLKSPDSQTRL